MKEKSTKRLEKKMEKVTSYIPMVISTRAIGTRTSVTAKVEWYTQKWTRLIQSLTSVKSNYLSWMMMSFEQPFMRATGKMECLMVTDLIHFWMERNTREHGLKVKWRVMESILSKVELTTSASLMNSDSMEKVSTPFPTGIYMKGIGSTEKLTVKVKSINLMTSVNMEIGLMEWWLKEFLFILMEPLMMEI